MATAQVLDESVPSDHHARRSMGLQPHFDLRRGEVVGLVGESGCGKTVTSMAVLGLLRGGGRVASGTALFNGNDLFAMSARARAELRGSGIAFISQEPIASLDPAFTVGHQLAEVARRHKDCTRDVAQARVLELLQMVQLRDPKRVAKKGPHELSGGMAQRPLSVSDHE
jgi:peptide/nickel transport system permease protein